MKPAMVPDVRKVWQSLNASGLTGLQSFAPLICTMLETLLKYEADKARPRAALHQLQ